VTCDSEAAPNDKPEAAPVNQKVSYVGAPAIFELTQCCQQINDAFGHYGCYLVGSSLARPDWRDVDVRFIMADDEFAKLFPAVENVKGRNSESWVSGNWEFDPRWLLLNVSISQWLRSVTGLPVDFQIQPQTHANARHKGPRHALGLRFAKPEPCT